MSGTLLLALWSCVKFAVLLHAAFLHVQIIHVAHAITRLKNLASYIGLILWLQIYVICNWLPGT